MTHDVASVAGGQSLHGGAVQLPAVLSLHQRRDRALHVGRGRAVGHVQGQRVVAGRGATLSRLTESSTTIGKPNLEKI